MNWTGLTDFLPQSHEICIFVISSVQLQISSSALWENNLTSFITNSHCGINQNVILKCGYFISSVSHKNSPGMVPGKGWRGLKISKWFGRWETVCRSDQSPPWAANLQTLNHDKSPISSRDRDIEHNLIFDAAANFCHSFQHKAVTFHSVSQYLSVRRPFLWLIMRQCVLATQILISTPDASIMPWYWPRPRIIHLRLCAGSLWGSVARARAIQITEWRRAAAKRSVFTTHPSRWHHEDICDVFWNSLRYDPEMGL